MYQHAGLPGARTCEHEEVAGVRGYSLSLGFIQIGQNIGNVHHESLPELIFLYSIELEKVFPKCKFNHVLH
jgi:hypothetical protein